ncbi:MAG: hypothetical protein HKN18_12170 [Silicimonas sp.]|nr:hypothetical protein [Silicimonas sp.]
MSMAQGQRSGFEDRLSRIRKGGDNTMGEVHIGPRDEVRAGEGKAGNTVRLKQKKKKVDIGQGSGSSLLILAFIFGALSMFVGQVATFHFFQDGGLVPLDLGESAIGPYLPYAHIIIGGVLALLFCWTFRLTTLVRMVAMVIGLFVMVQYHTQMVQSVPGVYVKFFSKAYVKEVRAKA